MTEFGFLEPVDALYLRGNRLFGGPGEYSESLMPPWPSVAAGALRTRILADNHVDFTRYAQGVFSDSPILDIIGSPREPGKFRLNWFSLGSIHGDHAEIYFPLPADMVAMEENTTPQFIFPHSLPKMLLSSYPLSKLPVLKTARPSKLRTDLWLTHEGLNTYLAGSLPQGRHIVNTAELWSHDDRVGIALRRTARTTEQGRIYTSETVLMKEGVGFIVGVKGAEGFLPDSGLIRLGGDGRGAVIKRCAFDLPQPPWDQIEESGSFKLMLVTPALFPQGWLPPGTRRDGDQFLWSYEGCRARLVAACFGRAIVISGWDLAARRPKQAFLAVPAGSVYWFEGLEGDLGSLKALQTKGLWPQEIPEPLKMRKVEGFNSVLVALWPENI